MKDSYNIDTKNSKLKHVAFRLSWENTYKLRIRSAKSCPSHEKNKTSTFKCRMYMSDKFSLFGCNNQCKQTRNRLSNKREYSANFKRIL